jgi:protein-tyrosine phosphatase
MTVYCVNDCNGKPCAFKEGHPGQCHPIHSPDEWFPLPTEPFTEVAPGLSIGSGLVQPDPADYDSVLTLHRSLPAMPAPVMERRWHISDGQMPDKDDLASVVGWVIYRWVIDEDRVLIRCMQGLNRSGLVAARALIGNLVDPAEAIDQIRRTRSPYALCNPVFVAHLQSFGSLSDVF